VIRRTEGRERDQAVELWTWLFSSEEREALTQLPGVAGLRDLRPPLALGATPLALGLVRSLPRRMRYALPVLPVLQIELRKES
jgi:hypothetical protein